ncbi:MAG TPA: hypothetical protein PK646_03835 [Bacillota bacterium]|nr:hypothetical protein [Fastidiosipila sp.]HPX93429.1 hypothetical protein [Bacillota bacterium]HQB81201.1 hypothetical protein [Bacillota bacterium]
MSGLEKPAQQDPEQADRPLSFDTIACSSQLREQLARLAGGSRIPILLTGEEGSGKHYIARRLAAAILCDQPHPSGGACGHCASCRMLRSGSHLDLIELSPPDDKSSIPVASIRSQVAGTLQIYPQISRNRVYWVEALKADTLNEQGQNALLKPLEEHPDFARFIILAEDVDRLLPTIRSRSSVVRIGRRSREEIRRILEESGSGERAAGLALRFADGLPGQALAMARDETFRSLRDQTFSLFSLLPRASRTYCLTEGLAFFKENRGEFNIRLRLMESFLRDLLLLQNKMDQEGLVNLDLADALEAMYRQAPAADPAKAAELVRQTARALASNANFDHTLARMLLGLRAFLGGHPVPANVFRARDGFL